MSFLKSWFADRPPTTAAAPEVPVAPESIPIALPALLDGMRAALGEIEPGLCDPDVVRAKLADLCRGLSVEPLDPLEFDGIAAGLDKGGWERMGLLVLAVERGALGGALRRAIEGRPKAFCMGFAEAARGAPLLDLDLLRSAPLRLEELSRRLVVGLCASIAGETLEASRATLTRLDYGRLMAEAERARRGVDPKGRGSP